MILFIDLRGQTPSRQFAFYSEGKFMMFNQRNLWSSWDDFEFDYKESGNKKIKAFRAIVPDWVYENPYKVKEKILPIKLNNPVNVYELYSIINDVCYHNALHHGYLEITHENNKLVITETED